MAVKNTFLYHDNFWHLEVYINYFKSTVMPLVIVVEIVYNLTKLQKQAKDGFNYAGATERELLAPLLQQSSCSYKVKITTT